MRVTDVRERATVDEASACAWSDTGWLVLVSGLTAASAVAAVHGLDGVPAAALWALVGFAAGDALSALGSAVESWRELHQVRRCATCRGAAVAMDAAWWTQRHCVKAHHRPDPFVKSDDERDGDERSRS